jgi:hypothetical protein
MLPSKVHLSRPTGFEIYGQQLEAQDTIQENDVYLTSDGRKWKKCGRSFAGMRVGATPSIIVRPLPVAIFPPPPLPTIRPRTEQIKQLPYRCVDCRSDLKDYFEQHNERNPKASMGTHNERFYSAEKTYFLQMLPSVLQKTFRKEEDFLKTKRQR